MRRMVKNRKTARRLISPLGVALLAMLMFGAIAATAQAAPTWRIEGEEFFGEETFTEQASWSAKTGDPFKLEVPGWNYTISCKSETGQGRIFGGDEGEVEMEATGCKVVNMPKCIVDPIQLSAHIDLIQVGGFLYEKFTPTSQNPAIFGTLTVHGVGCYSTIEGTVWLPGSFASRLPKFSEESVALPSQSSMAIEQTTGTGLWVYEEPMYLANLPFQSLSGARAGEAWGADWWEG